MTAPLRIGLTGSIGMGKSTTADLFAQRGFPVWDADAAVHRLYSPGGAATDGIRALVPGSVSDEGGVDRETLKALIAEDPGLLPRIEAVVHPLVAADRARFVAEQEEPAVILDIPLLFETGAEPQMDLVLVVSTDAERQRARVLARPGMTLERFGAVLAKQVPDAEKRRRADFVIRTDTPESAAQDVETAIEMIETLRRTSDARDRS